MKHIRHGILRTLLAGATLMAGAAAAGDGFITVVSTTSTENSGLYEHLLPEFTRAKGIEVRVVAVGTGQAIRLAANGDADVLLVHHKSSEEEFVAHGHGVERFDLMYNDFVFIGPQSDPAGIQGSGDALRALAAIAESKSPFTSRGDDSGTHRKELDLWKAAGFDPDSFGNEWYRETGSGMGATLNVASSMNAYVISDRSTWLNFGNRGELKVLVEGDERLFNPYGIIMVNPERHPHVKAQMAQTFIEWTLSDNGQQAIAEYEINGQQAFFPNARR